MAYELYQVLELSTQATAEQIKRSYFRLVRKYSPENDPERFKSIREAYDTLRDPKAKENYDSLQQHGEEISKLVSKAQENMSEGEWKAAIPLLKKAIVLLPGANAARNQLAICFAREQNWDNALKIYRKLTRDNPDIPLYWSNYGAVFKDYAESLDDNNSKKKELYQQAREQYQKAIDLEPYNSEPYLNIARSYTDEYNYNEALLWAERAISADGKTDLNDFETLFYIGVIYSYSGELDKIQILTQRIISLLPEHNEDAGKYVAARFYNHALGIYKLGFKSSSITILKAASSFFKAAKTFDPDDEDTKQLKGRLDQIIQAYDKFDSLAKDSEISSGFSQLAAFYLASYLEEEIEDRETVFKSILNIIFSVNPTQIIYSVRRIKSYYFSIYWLNESLFDKIEEVAQERSSESNIFDGIGKIFDF